MFTRITGLLALSSLTIGAPTHEEKKRSSYGPALTSNIAEISEFWGQISPYTDNAENYFGVNDVGRTGVQHQSWPTAN